MSAAPETQIPILARDIPRIEADADTSLSGLAPGAEAVIVAVDGASREALRLRDLGLVRGTRICAVTRAPLGDPIAYDLRGYRLCLRRSETDRVRVRRV